jgi:hypothetical protein
MRINLTNGDLLVISKELDAGIIIHADDTVEDWDDMTNGEHLKIVAELAEKKG